MTNEDFIERTSIELCAIFMKISERVDKMTCEERSHLDGCRMRVALGALDSVIELLECDNVRDFNRIAEDFDLTAEDCTYIADVFGEQ